MRAPRAQRAHVHGSARQALRRAHRGQTHEEERQHGEPGAARGGGGGERRRRGEGGGVRLRRGAPAQEAR